jgi:putative membrane protein
MLANFAFPFARVLQRGADEAWDADQHPWLHPIAVIGPWVLGAISAFLVLRALARWNRYRAVSVLGPDQQAAVRDAVRAAEKRTSGEIVPVILERSDGHPSAEWRCALFALLGGSALLERFLPWSVPHELLFCQLVLGSAGFLLARCLPDLARLFVSEARATESAEEQSLQEFYRQGLRETRERTGVLIFVSLYERRVIVLGDAGIHARVGDAHWQRTRDAILDGVARGSVADGLVAGVRACGEVLAEHFPAQRGDLNELPDRLIVRAR